MVFGSTHLIKKTEEKQLRGRQPQKRADGFQAVRFFVPRSCKKTMQNFFTTKRICRAGVIAALYVALTCAFGAIAYTGIFEIRPAEALCVLPLFFPEAVPALWIGCMLANLISQYTGFDVLFGGLATLISAFLTYGAGRLIKNHALKVAVGGFFPVIINAFVIPAVIVFLCGDLMGRETVALAYWYSFASMCLTEGIWIWALGSMLYFSVLELRKRGVSAFTDGKQQPQAAEGACAPPENEA